MLTRGKITCPVYGIVTELPTNHLHTIGDVKRFYALVKSDISKNTQVPRILFLKLHQK